MLLQETGKPQQLPASHARLTFICPFPLPPPLNSNSLRSLPQNSNPNNKFPTMETARRLLRRLHNLFCLIAAPLLSFLPLPPRRLPSLVAVREAVLCLAFLRRGLVPRTVAVGPTSASLHFWIPAAHRPGRPSLVLVHGFGGNAKWQWERQIGPLSRSFDLYIPDLVFFGRSRSDGEDRSVGFQARCVVEGMRRLGVEQYAVVGISYGGFVAFRMAVMAAEAVDRVVILTAGICSAEKRRELVRNEGRDVSEILLPQRAEDLVTLLRRSMYRPPRWIPAFLLRDFIEVMYKDRRKERVELLKELLQKGVDMEPLPVLKQETLILWGDQDKVFPLSLAYQLQSMGSFCSRQKPYNEADAEENEQAEEIERRIARETKAEQHIHKLLLLGAGESGKSTIFKQIKLLFQTGFDEAELRSYTSVIHANVYQTIKILFDGAKELTQNESDSSKYVVSCENKDVGEKLSDIGSRLDYPYLTKEIANEIKTLWNDAAIQEAYSRGNILQVPDCAQYFMENLERLSETDYVPTKEDVLYARVRTTGVVEIQFSPVGESRKSGEVYRLYDVGGQRNERRKWIHLFEGVRAVIFCAAISEYDQMLFEDETKNRMMETKELFDWVLKQACFEKTSFMLFLNKFDIFEQKVQKVPLNVCEWFKDYQPMASGKQEVEHAYEFVKKKFEELYFQSTKPERVDRVFKIYRTTALDQKLVKKTFKLVDETLRRRNLIEAGLL
ncbi:guanine nucleotide-binding protein alpha-1 subunit isoform X2 [Elaeis guineensis]|uniref:Guanine nucleotide-binding protein alpha subunit n=1 Tax=Elaeis guineensis var. tenera TaxID=51953 RepID=A0A8N4F9B6_ELAGV|nr:guanine nucleotide-binding protein alpha-1 subunit isoform X2 [Elaeis guineensis]